MTTSTPKFLRAALAALTCVCSLLPTSAVHAADARTQFDIPAGQALTTLKQFTAQSGEQLLYSADAVQGLTTKAVKGSYTPRDALDQMVSGTNLTVVADKTNGALSLLRAPSPKAPRVEPEAGSVRPPQKNDAREEAVVLSPFEVSTERDTGYAASQSLSGSRLASELRFIPAPVSVITREQLDDFAITDLQEAMQWTVNTTAANSSEAGGALNQGTPVLSPNDNDIRTRGRILLSTTRNFFRWSVNSDTYNIERLDLSRGPNALLFGDSNLSGAVNISTKRAHFKPAASVQAQTSSYGGGRISLDVNRPLLGQKLAVRLNAFAQQSADWRDFGQIDRKGATVTSTWRPAPGLEIRLEGEMGWRNNIYAPPYLKSVTSAWNHVAVFNAPGSLTAAQASAAGLGRIGANVFTLNAGRPHDGLFNWATLGQTVAAGTQSFVGVKLPPGSTLQPVSVLEPARLSSTPVFTDFVVPSFAFSMKNGANRLASEHHTASLFIEKRVGRNLMIEVAGNLQVEDRLNYTRQSGNVDLAYDVNRLLPAGYTIDGRNDNPYFLQPYLQSYQRIFNTYSRVWETRAAAVYRWEKPWFRQSIGLLTAYRRFDAGQRRFTLTRTNGPVANLANAANAVYVRSYVAERQFSSIDYLQGHDYTVGDARIEYVNHSGVVGGQSAAISHINSFQAFAAGSLLPSERIHTVLGIRRDEFYSRQYNDHIFDPVTGRYVRSVLTEILRSTIDSPTAGVVVEVLPWLGVYANTSRSYNPPTTSVLNFQNHPIEAPQGKTRELGLKFALLQNRVSGSLGFYQSEQKNNSIGVNSQNAVLDNIHELLGLPLYGTLHDTNTLSARGAEFELHANLSRAWTLTANLGVPHSDTRDSYPSFRALYAENQAAWQAIANNAADPRSTTMRTYLNTIDTQLRNSALGDGEEDNFNRRFTANLLARYQFLGGRLQGLALGAGMNYFGDQKIGRDDEGANINSKGYALYSAFVRYRGDWRGRSWSLQANATNLLDTEKFRYLQAGTDQNNDPYRVVPPRLIRVTLNFSF